VAGTPLFLAGGEAAVSLVKVMDGLANRTNCAALACTTLKLNSLRCNIGHGGQPSPGHNWFGKITPACCEGGCDFSKPFLRQQLDTARPC
jgi:hypothetical protein